MSHGGGPHVDGVTGVVGANQEVRIVVVVKIHSTRQRPAKGPDLSIEAAGVDDLPSIKQVEIIARTVRYNSR